MPKPLSAVYIIEHPSGAFYIGATTNLTARWRTHRTRLRAGMHRAAQLQALVVDHDITPFTVRPLLLADRANLTMYEARILAAYSRIPGFANHTLSAKMTFPSAATREVMAMRQRGQPKSAVARKRMSETKRGAIANGWRPASYGKPMSEEQKRKISATRKERFAAGLIINPMLGKKHSLEALQKIRHARRSRHAQARGG